MDQFQLLGTINTVTSSLVTATLVSASGDGSAEDFNPHKAGRLGTYVMIYDDGLSIIGSVAAVRPGPQGSDGSPVMDIQLIGTLSNGRFERGVSIYPSVGSSVYTASADDLSLIFSFYRNENFSLGTLSGNSAERLYLNPNKFFSKHIALFGSTGSGKSCTTASILQKVASLENTHIVLLDLHGEYHAAFADTGNHIKITELELPYWLMNFDELVETLIDETEPSAMNQMMVMKEAILDSKRGKNLLMKDYITIDTPVYFDFLDVSARMRSLDTERTLSGKEGPFYGQFTRFLVRLESKLTDKRYEFLFRPKVFRSSETFADLLSQLFAFDTGKHVTVIDLSRVPSDVSNVLVSLVGRIIYDFNLWNAARQDFPVLIVFEEAHTYLSMTGRSQAARKTVERIAKEGRKYGVSCMIVSQRPSEISETITAQCNNFVSMRLLNPHDQEYVRKLVPDAMSNLIDVLPTLQQGEAFIIGDSIPLPSRVQIDMPDPEPASSDVRFFDKWNNKTTITDVGEVVNNWWKQIRT
jgi:DNA helicase HerA-like ATPase